MEVYMLRLFSVSRLGYISTGIIFSLFFVLFMFSCSNATTPDEGKLTPDQHAALVGDELTEANNEFAISFLKQLNETHTIEEEDISVSPLSLSIALSMTYNGAQNETATQMAELLECENMDLEDFNQQYLHLLSSLENCDSSLQLDIANSMWIQDSYFVYDDFIQTNQTYYLSEVSNAPFDETTVTAINNWVYENTNGKITDIIQQVTPNERLFILNALYFKGNWTYQFDPQETEEMNFNLYDNTVKQVQMMKSGGTDFTYYFTDNFTLCRIPYGQDKIAMYILLPDFNSTTDDIISELSAENWDLWKNSCESLSDEDAEYFQFMLPKFRVEYEKTLNQDLIAMGMELAFTPEADFKKISPSAQLWISYVKQKTFLEVNEEGSEATAVTIISFEDAIYPSFIVNRPFLYFINDDRSNTILFMGAITNPEYEQN